MKPRSRHITVFEHQTIRLNQEIDGVPFDAHALKGLQAFHGEKGVPYYSLTHNGVHFREYVGVIQVGDTVIEVLPKADNAFAGAGEKSRWRDILIEMLSAVGRIDVHAPSSSSLLLKNNSILDLYYELFIREVEYLLHNGLIRQYRTIEGNTTALKGSLQFGKHLQQNLSHQERFYVRHSTYDVEHNLHRILWKAIRLLKQINTSTGLHSRIGSLMLHFPDMSDIAVTEATFENLVFTRKNQLYKTAVDIARLLLLKYHPDLTRGKNDVLAVMFDMNTLWEEFVYVSLHRYRSPETTVAAYITKSFWKPKSGGRSQIRPDIVVNNGKPNCAVLDTKWKNLNGQNPTLADLRQMYVYHHYYAAKRVALIYPGSTTHIRSGTYLSPDTRNETDMECSIITLSVSQITTVKAWQRTIWQRIDGWMTGIENNE